MERTFEDFGFCSGIMEGLSVMGYDSPTPIQQEAIPLIQEGVDLVGCAQTGTGKTAAFLLPILDRLACCDEPKTHRTTVLIIAPTRELVMQIDQQIEGFAYFVPVSSKAIYGGNDGQQWGLQREAVDAGVNILVATPGRLIQFLQLGIADFSRINTLVLDEADRMLDMGFFPDIRRIVSELPRERQTLFFSATMPEEVRALTKAILRNPRYVNIAVSRPASGVEQWKLPVGERAKIGFLVDFFAARADITSAIVFAERKRTVRDLTVQLSRRGLSVVSIHADLSQEERERSLVRFKSRGVRVLVATDIVARGIDIEEVDLVVNFNVPTSPESYVHRVGRTARAASRGESLTLVSPNDGRLLKEIERFLGGSIALLPPVEGVVLPDSGVGEEKERPSGGRSGRKGKGGSARRPNDGGKQQRREGRPSDAKRSGGKRKSAGRRATGSNPQQ